MNHVITIGDILAYYAICIPIAIIMFVSAVVVKLKKDKGKK